MAAHDHTGNIGFWRKYADDSLATDSYFDDAERVRTKVDLDGAKDAPPPNKDTTQERRFPVRALSSQHAAERIEVLNEVPFELDPVEPPLGREALMDIVPLGALKTDFNFCPEDRPRVVNAIRVVTVRAVSASAPAAEVAPQRPAPPASPHPRA